MQYNTLARVRFQTVTRKPWRRRLAAIALPMMPRPRNPTSISAAACFLPPLPSSPQRARAVRHTLALLCRCRLAWTPLCALLVAGAAIAAIHLCSFQSSSAAQTLLLSLSLSPSRPILDFFLILVVFSVILLSPLVGFSWCARALCSKIFNKYFLTMN
jgi:hypothetical protein